jgi:hypothetical protein
MKTMPFAAGLGVLAVLFAAGAAQADPATRTVADLASRACIPALREHELKPEMIWPEVEPVSAENIKILKFSDGGRYWATKADDDIVFLELVGNRCRVFTSKLGSAAFLPVLEDGLNDAFNKPVQVSDTPHSTKAGVRVRAYSVHIDGEEDAKVVVSYPIDGVAPDDRIILISVIVTHTKLVDK